jgi:hypothetical protein
VIFERGDPYHDFVELALNVVEALVDAAQRAQYDLVARISWAGGLGRVA